MSVLKIAAKEDIKLLMDFDYNNVLGRLKYVLGKDAAFFADVRIRQNDITWSTKDNVDFKPFCEAPDREKQLIKTSLNSKIAKFDDLIAKDTLIGDFTKQIMTYPSDQYLFYAQVGGEYRILMTGWGCENNDVKNPIQQDIQNTPQRNIHQEGQPVSPPSHISLDNNSQRKAYDSKRNPKLLADGFFIANNKNRSRDIEDTQSNSKLVILKSIILILLAAIIALIIPMILTGGLNRLVADITHQWYLNGFSRVVITVIVAIVTYSVSYALIRFTTFKKSIVFNVVCFILTFLWAVCMGIAWIPD